MNPTPARILLGVSGGIAAYKAAELARLLQQRGARVRAILTRGAQRFVTPLTFEALTGGPALTELFTAAQSAPGSDEFSSSIEHIRLAQSADLLLIAPATANLIARLANGLANDLLSTVYLATPAPVLLAPAMNTRMWNHPAMRDNLEKLRRHKVEWVEPESGPLACGMIGPGRLASLETIIERAWARLEPRPADLNGETVLVTAGPTREPLDAARFLSNRSSGRMGYGLAQAAAERGARVILISGPVALATPEAGQGTIEVVRVQTAAEMAAAANAAFEHCDLALMAAAVADYRPAAPSREKPSKQSAGWELQLEPTPDILAELGRRKRRQFLVGFAAEAASGDESAARARARAKLRAKNADLIVYNDISRADIGFDQETNAVVLMEEAGETELPRATKLEIAHAILDTAQARRRASAKTGTPHAAAAISNEARRA